MTQKEQSNLMKQFRSLMKVADRYDAIVVCEDGKETNNSYPIRQAYEHCPDTKTPEDWICGIAFHHSISKLTCKVTLALKKGAGKYPWE